MLNNIIKINRSKITRKDKMLLIRRMITKMYYIGIAIKLKDNLKCIKYPVKYQKINENLTYKDKINILIHMYKTIQVIKKKLPEINNISRERNLSVVKILVTKYKHIHIIYKKK